jgi:hypothetical protein
MNSFPVSADTKTADFQSSWPPRNKLLKITVYVALKDVL